MVKQHAYVVQRVFTDYNGRVTRVRLFNPHGRDSAPTGTADSNPGDGLVTVTPAQFMANFVAYDAATI